MNVFVLCTGRSGSVTFTRACEHITNYTTAHESRSTIFGPKRFDYPANHIEADNRLSWLLGRLDERYGASAFYVHLTRDKHAVAESFVERWGQGIIGAYASQIVIGDHPDELTACLDYCDTIEKNIELFLRDKPNKMLFRLETAEADFRWFWDAVRAEGDLEAALSEWGVRHNATMDKVTPIAPAAAARPSRDAAATSPYQLESCFDRHALETPDGRRKAQLFAALAPAGCRSILDAGGGTGWSTVGLRESRRVVTLDSSAESLAHAPGETVLASVDDLPFGDRAFDMVMSSQVLEHLPDEILRKAAAEMRRVAKHWILVSTPYREALETRFVRCGACGHAFHPDYHVRSFSEHDLARLFPGWMMAEWHVFGAVSGGIGVEPLKPVKVPGRKAGLAPAGASTLCPQCGAVGRDDAPAAERAPSFATRIVNGLSRRTRGLLGLPQPQPYPTFLPQAVAPYWIAGLFVREGADAVDGDIDGLQRSTPGARVRA